MEMYHKIECPFKRSTDGSKQIVWDKWRNPTVEFLKNNIWFFTEKVDGTNIRVHWDGHCVSFAGRTDKAKIPAMLNEYLTATFKTNEVEELFEQSFGEKEVTLFGEGYGAKIQGCGSAYRKDNSFILFDVMINGNYQSYETVEEIAEMLNIDVVPVVVIGTIYDAIEFVMEHPKSTISQEDLYMEGLVGRPMVELQDRCGHRLIVKIKWEDFRQFANCDQGGNKVC